MIKTLILICSLLLIPNRSFPQVNQANTKYDLEYTKKFLTKEINKIIKETGIPSFSITLFNSDSIIWSKAFGYANVKKQVPATSSTYYHIGSNTKFITATAIMQLAEAGKLDIDDPINKYLEESAIDDLSSEGTPVTFRHLLSHNSGLKGSTLQIPLWERKLPKTLEELASEISAEEPPGKNYKYCNHCFALAGLLIEKISGQSYQEYIVENILKPLQIETEGPITPTPAMVEELALPYSLTNNKSVPQPQSRLDVFPAGDIYMTSPEMANFYIAHMNNGSFKGQSILDSTTVADMQETQFGSEYGLGPFGSEYGLGPLIFERDGEKYLYHYGGTPGFSSFFQMEMTSKSGAFVASNSGLILNVVATVGNLGVRLIKDHGPFEPLPSFASRAYIITSSEVLNKYVGAYELTPEYKLSITQDGMHIYAQVTGLERFELSAYEEDKFFLDPIGALVHFKKENGKVTSLIIFANADSEGMVKTGIYLKQLE